MVGMSCKLKWRFDCVGGFYLISFTFVVEGLDVNHSKILNGILKNELIEEAVEEGWLELETVCCVVLLLVAVAVVEIFYIKMKRKK